MLGVVLSEEFVTIGVEDGLIWVAGRQALAILVAVSVVFGPTVDGEVGRLVDKRPGLGICTKARGIPERTTQVNRSELVGI